MNSEIAALIDTLCDLKQAQIKAGWGEKGFKECESNFMAYVTGYENGQLKMINLILKILGEKNVTFNTTV